jgi:polar amino acid transport system substrate-binding protein
VTTCGSCGKELPGEFPFCPFCAAPLTEQPAASVHEERKIVIVLFCDLMRRSALSLCVVALVSACGGIDAAGSHFEPAQPGVLTVATAFLPAPGFWMGKPPTQGFEAQLASALAKKLGLDRVRVVQVPFGQIIKGQFHGADLALSQLTPTEEREHSVDFSAPYLSAPPGVLARVEADAADAHDLRELQWVVSRLSTLTPVVRDRVRPTKAPIEVEDRTEALEALRFGRANALMLDLPVALGLARDEASLFHVLGQLDGEADIAAALPNGSANREIVDSAIRGLQADGTIDRLFSRWFGTSADDVPLIRTEER